MSDRYQGFVSSPIGKLLVKNLGLPSPTRLERYADGRPPRRRAPSCVGGAGRLAAGLPAPPRRPGHRLDHGRRRRRPLPRPAVRRRRHRRAGRAARALRLLPSAGVNADTRPARVIVLGRPPETVPGGERIAQRALEGFIRSLGKEVGRGGTAQLVYVAAGGETRSARPSPSCCRPGRLTSAARSCEIGTHGATPARRPPTGVRPLAGKVALVTGAAAASASTSRGCSTVRAPPSSASTPRRPPASSRR